MHIWQIQMHIWQEIIFAQIAAAVNFKLFRLYDHPLKLDWLLNLLSNDEILRIQMHMYNIEYGCSNMTPSLFETMKKLGWTEPNCLSGQIWGWFPFIPKGSFWSLKMRIKSTLSNPNYIIVNIVNFEVGMREV